MSNIAFSQAKMLIIQGQFDKCSILIKKSLKLEPHNPDLLLLDAFLNRKNSKFEDALIDLELAYKNLPDKSPLEPDIRNQIGLTYNEMGMFLYKKSRFVEALAIFNESLKFKENDWGILLNKGDCLLKLQKIMEALIEIKKAEESYKNLIKKTHGLKNTEICARLAHVNYLLGLKEFNNKEYTKGIDFFEKMIENRSDLSEYYVIRGKCYYEMKDFKNAFEDFQKALELDKNNIDANNSMRLIKKPMSFHSKHVIYLDEA